MATLGNCVGDNYIVPGANPCLGVTEVIGGTNVTITGTQYQPIINATGGGGGGGVTSLAYTTGINGSAATGAVTLSNTGVTSIVAGTGITIAATGVGGTGAVTVNNNGLTSIVGGSNIIISGGNTVNVISDPVFNNSMGFVGSGTNSIFSNVVYPYGLPQYYPYVTNAGTDVLNTIGGKQFWATLTPGSTTVPVMRYRYDGIQAQQANTGTTIPFLFFNDTTGLFGLSNTSNVVNSNIAGTGISVSGATGNVTITNTGVTSLIAGTNISITSTLGAFTINSSAGGGGVTSLAYTTGITGSASTGAITLSNTGVTSLSLTGGGGLYNLGTATDPILGALVVNVLSGTGISVSPSSGNYTVTNTGVTSIVAGTGITVSGATGAVTINAGSKNSIFTPVINGLWTAIDGDVELLDRPLSFSVINNLDTAETIVVHFSCGPILGVSTAGPTNASYFSMKALVSPSALGTPVPTAAYGQYVVEYGATMGGDFVVVLSKSRGEFFADSSLIQLYKMDLPAAPFSSAILPFIAVPNIYVNIYAM